MAIRDRIDAKSNARRRAWSQRVLDAAVSMIAADANTVLISAVVDSQPEYARIVYRSRWWPRPLGYRGHIPEPSGFARMPRGHNGAPIQHDSVREFAEYLSRLSVCEPLGNYAEVLTLDGGIEWWGDGYPTLAPGASSNAAIDPTTSPPTPPPGPGGGPGA